jgi:hypothetical protein
MLGNTVCPLRSGRATWESGIEQAPVAPESKPREYGELNACTTPYVAESPNAKIGVLMKATAVARIDAPYSSARRLSHAGVAG